MIRLSNSFSSSPQLGGPSGTASASSSSLGLGPGLSTSFSSSPQLGGPPGTASSSSGPGPSLTFGSVFWDLENCGLSSGGPRGFEVVRRIKDLARERGVSLTNIVVVANLERISPTIKLDLEESGVVLQNVSSGKPSASDIGILAEIVKVVYHFRPPHWIFLISGDRDFSKVLSFLDGCHYRVVLIHPPKVSPILLHAVAEHIAWTDLLNDSFGVLEANNNKGNAHVSTPTPSPPLKPSLPSVMDLPSDSSELQETQTLAEGDTEPAQPSSFSPDKPTLDPSRIPPERFLPLLVHLRKQMTSTKSSFVRTALLTASANKCFPDLAATTVFELAASLHLVRLDPYSDTACMTEAGLTLLGRYKGRRLWDATECIGPVLEVSDPTFWPILRKLVDHILQTNNEPMPLRKLAGSLDPEAHARGFPSVLSYLQAARNADVLSTDPPESPAFDIEGNKPDMEITVTISPTLEPFLQTRGVPDKWFMLVRVIASLNPTAVPVPVNIVLASLKGEYNTWNHGYQSGKLMLQAAAEAGIVTLDKTTVALDLSDIAVANSYANVIDELKKKALAKGKADAVAKKPRTRRGKVVGGGPVLTTPSSSETTNEAPAVAEQVEPTPPEEQSPAEDLDSRPIPLAPMESLLEIAPISPTLVDSTEPDHREAELGPSEEESLIKDPAKGEQVVGFVDGWAVKNAEVVGKKEDVEGSGKPRSWFGYFFGS